jgi:16S rRNA (cytidine1402-2'-O)-methyltransferase
VSGKLLSHYGVKGQKWVYHDHNAQDMRPKILEAISNGKSVALISDAGTPLINDPGTKLVRACQEAGLYVTTLPGASAVPCALILSGLMSQAFAFVGFFDKKTISNWADFKGSLVFFESPRRLVATLEIMRLHFVGRKVAVVREISKMFEESITGDFEDVLTHYTNHPPKGEVVIVLGDPPEPEATSDEVLLSAMEIALKTMSLKDAADMVSKQYKMPKKTVYGLGLSLKKHVLNE